MNGAFASFDALTFGRRLLGIKNPVIVTHTRPDGDTVGTAAALCAFYREKNIPVGYMSDGDIPERLAFLMKDERRVTDPQGYTPIAVDVAASTQLGGLSDVLGDGNKIALMLDHHAVGMPFADGYIDASASSAGEVLFSVFSALEADGIPALSVGTAEKIYAAVSSDTGGFRFSNATAKTHAAVAGLLAFDFDHADIDRRLFDEKPLTQIRAESLVGRALRTRGDITYAVIDKAAREAAGLAFSDFETAIDVVRSLSGTAVAFTVKETDDRDFRVSLRSTGTDVAAVAAAFGGGGHIRAAGCNVQAEDAAAAAEKILAGVDAARKTEKPV